MSSIFLTAVKELFTRQNMQISGEQAVLFEKYFDMIAEKNKVMNLTRILDPEEAAQKHFFDSVSILKYIDIKQNAKVIDIGTGAGFPGIPLKIMRPDLQITLLDSSSKKIDFVYEAAKIIGLDVNTLSARAEELSLTQPCRESFDYAVSRAVASLPMLLELSIPFIKTGGQFIAYKGADYEAELALCRGAEKQLHLNLKDIYMPYAERSHALIVYQKLQNTPPKYPRKFSVIKIKPL